MKIAINCRSFLTKQYTGIGRYADHLIRSLSEIDTANAYSLYAPKGLFDFKRQLPEIQAKNFTLLVDRFNKGVRETVGPVDIYHAPSLEDLPEGIARTVVTVHDVIFKSFPEGHTEETIVTSERQMKGIVQRARRIICCSKSTQRDLKRFYNVEDDRLRLVYQGVDKDMFYVLNESERVFARGVLKKYAVTEPFLLFVGTIEPRKNLLNLLKAYAILREAGTFTGPLVVIGAMGWKNDAVGQTVTDLHLEKHVRFLGFLPNHELRCFYNLTEVFVFPSLYEGFGFPILEAMSCGAMVVTSNVSSCPEVSGDAALLVDPHQPGSIAQAIGIIVSNDHLRSQLKERSVRRAAEFSFLETARQTLKVYQELM